MKQWRASMSVVVLVAILLVGGGAAEGPGRGASRNIPSFAALCRAAEEGSAARITVDLILRSARTADCETAQERLLERHRLRLAFREKRELSDLAPLCRAAEPG